MEKTINKVLMENGLKITKSRQGILRYLFDSKEPLTAEKIFLDLKSNEIKVNLSTVYRTLEIFVSKNMILKVPSMENDKMLYEFNSMEHKHYLICERCKKITTIKNCPLGNYEKELEKDTGFHIEGHRLYLYGYCKKCQKDSEKQ